MAGIYIHIPFCKQSCIYCDFHFSTSLKYKEPLVEALIKEIEQKSTTFREEINTVYLGGGTPSLLNYEELNSIMEALYNNYNVSKAIEFTVECNPDDLSTEKLKSLKNLGVNRLSIGIQSFNNKELKFFNRTHNSAQAESCIKRSQDIGLENITIDLIYGSPLLTNEIWLNNLNKVNTFNVPHLSAYGLTVESKTALEHQIKLGTIPKLSDENMIAQFKMLIEKTKEFGFIQYEVSNFGKKGFYSQHNSNYWKGEKYLGFGPSAHSFYGNKRFWNVADNIKYIDALSQNITYFEEETIDERTAFNEYILTRLRTIWGVDLAYVSKTFSEKIIVNFKRELKQYLDSSYLKKIDNKVILSDKGILIADKITSDLFYV